MDKSIIKVRSMSFKYADKYIFKDFDMDIDTNSFVCIIGRNASGKSTLVKIFGGLCKASGYINVDGYLLNDTYIKKIRRSLAICFDDTDRHFIGDIFRTGEFQIVHIDSLHENKRISAGACDFYAFIGNVCKRIHRFFVMKNIAKSAPQGGRHTAKSCIHE